MIVLPEARKRGFAINEKNLQQQIKRTNAHLQRSKAKYLSGKGTGGQVDTAGMALWGLEAAGVEPNELTEAVTTYLLLRDKHIGHWNRTGRRPPSQASALTTTYLALRALDAFGTKQQQETIQSRRTGVRDWLKKMKPKDTEDRVSLLRLWHYFGDDDDAKKSIARAIKASQRDDGGWAQLPDMESDAYATATVLVALAQTESLQPDSAAYKRGVAYLIKQQKQDGSWHVKTRSRPIQTYFESGFPHGKDQFISMSATCWSVKALLLTLPDTHKHTKTNSINESGK